MDPMLYMSGLVTCSTGCVRYLELSAGHGEVEMTRLPGLPE